jgi:PAS domain S-box-containing protein
MVALRSQSPLITTLTVGAALLTFMVVVRQLAAMRDTLHHERAEARREAENRFRSLVANASDVIIVLSRDGVVVYASPSTQRLFGVPPEQLLGEPLERLLHPDEAPAARGFMEELLARPWGSVTRTWRLNRRDDAWAWGETTGTNLLADQAVGGIVLNTHDVSERRELEQRLSHQAMHDGLTGLPNRVLLRSRLEQVASPGRLVVEWVDPAQAPPVGEVLTDFQVAWRRRRLGYAPPAKHDDLLENAGE